MKNLFFKQFLASIYVGVVSVLMLLSANLYSQQVTQKDQSQVITTSNVASSNEKLTRAAMKRDGWMDTEIDKWEMQQKLNALKKRNAPAQVNKSGQLPVIM